MRLSHKSTNQIFLGLIYLMGDKNAFTHSGELRTDNDIGQDVIAEVLNVSQPTYSRYENRKIVHIGFIS